MATLEVTLLLKFLLLASVHPGVHGTDPDIYQGCNWDDSNNRLLSDLIFCPKTESVSAQCENACSRSQPYCQSSAMTIDMCRSICVNQNFRYYALQAGNQCFCGGNFAPFDRGGLALGCNYECSGDPSRNCGGEYRMDVYEVADPIQGSLCFHPGYVDTARNATRIGPNFRRGIILSYRDICPVGYLHQGPQALRCQQNGQWNGTTPTCVITCPDPPVPMFGEIRIGGPKDVYLAGDVFLFVCTAQAGRADTPYYALKCSEEGEWEGNGLNVICRDPSITTTQPPTTTQGITTSVPTTTTVTTILPTTTTLIATTPKASTITEKLTPFTLTPMSTKSSSTSLTPTMVQILSTSKSTPEMPILSTLAKQTPKISASTSLTPTMEQILSTSKATPEMPILSTLAKQTPKISASTSLTPTMEQILSTSKSTPEMPILSTLAKQTPKISAATSLESTVSTLEKQTSVVSMTSSVSPSTIKISTTTAKASSLPTTTEHRPISSTLRRQTPELSTPKMQTSTITTVTSDTSTMSSSRLTNTKQSKTTPTPSTTVSPSTTKPTPTTMSVTTKKMTTSSPTPVVDTSLPPTTKVTGPKDSSTTRRLNTRNPTTEGSDESRTSVTPAPSSTTAGLTSNAVVVTGTNNSDTDQPIIATNPPETARPKTTTRPPRDPQDSIKSLLPYLLAAAAMALFVIIMIFAAGLTCLRPTKKGDDRTPKRGRTNGYANGHANGHANGQPNGHARSLPRSPHDFGGSGYKEGGAALDNPAFSDDLPSFTGSLPRTGFSSPSQSNSTTYEALSETDTIALIKRKNKGMSTASGGPPPAPPPPPPLPPSFTSNSGAPTLPRNKDKPPPAMRRLPPLGEVPRGSYTLPKPPTVAPKPKVSKDGKGPAPPPPTQFFPSSSSTLPRRSSTTESTNGRVLGAEAPQVHVSHSDLYAAINKKPKLKRTHAVELPVRAGDMNTIDSSYLSVSGYSTLGYDDRRTSTLRSDTSTLRSNASGEYFDDKTLQIATRL